MKKKKLTGTYFPRGKRGNLMLKYYWRSPGEKYARCYRESTGSADEAYAKALLKKRITDGPPSHDSKAGFEALAQRLEDDYTANGAKSLCTVLNNISNLRRVFGNTTVAAITPTSVSAYVARRHREKAKASTIHKEVMALSRMLTLLRFPGKRRATHPEIVTVVVRNVRRRYIEDEDLPKLLGHMEPHYRAFFSFLALSGWRRGEALSLQWRMVDMKRGLIRIEDSKNSEPRTLAVGSHPGLMELLQQQREYVRGIERERQTVVAWVFCQPTGKPIGDPWDAWDRARKAAGMPWAWIHDMRRGAVRRLERAGVARSVATKISGHRSESVFRRYAITSERDVAEGLAKVADLDPLRAQIRAHAVEDDESQAGGGGS